MADRRPARPVTAHRFFLPAGALDTEPIRFPPELAHQIRRVLRLTTGDQAIVLDGSGWEQVVRLTVSTTDVSGIVEERRRNQAEPSLRLTLYQGLLKAAKFEIVLQKCTEIGVSRFVPIQTTRCVATEPGSARQRRFEAIVREAAEQCGRGRLPAIDEPLSFTEALDGAAAEGPVLFLWEEERAASLSVELESLRTDRAALFIGPEGGFTAAEAAKAQTAGARIVTLGPRILRAETAAISASALGLLTPSATYPYNRAQIGDIGEPPSLSSALY